MNTYRYGTTGNGVRRGTAQHLVDIGTPYYSGGFGRSLCGERVSLLDATGDAAGALVCRRCARVATAQQPTLREHMREFHKRAPMRRSTADLAREHAKDHHRFSGALGHYHAGPNPGPHLRPPGWRTGADVVEKQQP